MAPPRLLQDPPLPPHSFPQLNILLKKIFKKRKEEHWVKFMLPMYLGLWAYPLKCDWPTRGHPLVTTDPCSPSRYRLPLASRLAVVLRAHSLLHAHVLPGLPLHHLRHAVTTALRSCVQLPHCVWKGPFITVICLPLALTIFLPLFKIIPEFW